MVVTPLATGLIVFKILKVFLEVTPTSVERTLGSFSSTGVPKLRHILFIIIESGMALFAIQVVRLVISSVVESQLGPTPPSLLIAMSLVITIHQALNVIINLFIFYFFWFTDDVYLPRALCQQ